jgi:50S ribosomal protein L16 3-hydroxylase
MEQVAAARALYADPSQPATARPGQVPARLQRFAARALAQVLAQPGAVDRALGEALTEPKPLVWFDAGGSWQPGQGVALDARTRMLVDARHVHVNGQSWRAGGRDAQLLAQLADRRALGAAEVARLGTDALAVLQEWVQAGWAHAVDGSPVRKGKGRGGR